MFNKIKFILMDQTLTTVSNIIKFPISSKSKFSPYYLSIKKPQYKSSNNLSELLCGIRPKTTL